MKPQVGRLREVQGQGARQFVDGDHRSGDRCPETKEQKESAGDCDYARGKMERLPEGPGEAVDTEINKRNAGAKAQQ